MASPSGTATVRQFPPERRDRPWSLRATDNPGWGWRDVGLGSNEHTVPDPWPRVGGVQEEAVIGLAARGPQRAPAGGCGARRSPAARGRGSWLGQDPGAHPPHRVADRRAQGSPGLDPGDHLHQQGRRRDEGAGRGPSREACPDDVGLDLPLRVRADPAQGDRQAGLQVELLDLRRRRLQAADDPGLPGPRSRPEAVPAAGGAQLGLQRQERAEGRRGRGEGHPQPVRGVLLRGVRALSTPAARRQRARLRRPDHVHRPPLPAVPRGQGDLSPPVPARAGRRISGHQPRAVRPDPPAVR